MEIKQTENEYERELELDKLSNLPSDVTEKILSYLPTREAVRTSFLSRNWRHKWVTVPRLMFDDKTANRNSFQIQRVIDHVLLLHKGPVDSFKLSTVIYLTNNEFDRWIWYLSRFAIKEFILERRYPSDNYNVSSHLYSYKDLTHLELSNCSLNPPLTFKGFATLKNLNIQNVSVAKDVLEKIIVGCPLLERMILCDLESVDILNVDAPNLQFLKVVGVFKEVKLQNVPNLVHVSIGQKRIDYKEVSRRNSSKLLQYFLSLPRIERLTIEGCLLECVVNSFSLHTELPEPYPCLNFLSISMRLNSLDDILVAMYLLRSSPAIQVLEIEVRQESNAEEQATNWLNNNRLWEFTQLRRLKVTGFSGVTGEVDFLDYLFSRFPALQEIEISFRDYTNMGKGLDAAAGGDYSNRNWSLNQLRIMKVTNVRYEASFIRFLLSSSPMLNTMTLQPVSAGISWELLELLVKEFKRYSHAELKLLKPLSSESYNNDFYSDDVRCMCTSVPAVASGWDI
uniref:F-box/FBD/LRR-repeat protein At1g13570-like n=1 Tax=Fragaria vesca subsp. vesca TaxID=101020 RepID=UPI0005CA6B6F|nr:PREDICTED: F-box/FBD/LRR-repeat protein At1g13570-like [Fragaria vesca subsp. vesca]